MTLAEKLNNLDAVTDNHYDLFNSYYMVEGALTAQERSELKKLVASTNDPETIATYLQTKMQEESLEEDVMEESKFSRILAKTGVDGPDFAVIGSEDKDTKEDRLSELKALIDTLRKKKPMIGYEMIRGNYTYQDTGDVAHEYSYLISNISKDDAFAIARRVNQESIVWKDKTFFGIIDVNTNEVYATFQHGKMTFDKNTTSEFSSQQTKSKKDNDLRDKWAFV